MHIHDGDTLSFPNKTVLRLWRVDAPEMEWKGRWPQQPWAIEARDFLSRLCEQGVEQWVEKEKSYGRSVAQVTCNGTDVASALLETGHAWVYRHRSTRAFMRLQEQAREARIGLWADDFPVEPLLWRQGKQN
jgi:endonuclease YncB( thermonuclease family)